MIEIEYGEPKYVDGQHLPDCESQHPRPLEFRDDGFVLTVFICTGCLPLP